MKPQNRETILRQLEGLHTLKTAAEVLGLGRQSTLNLLSKLKKDGYVTLWQGGGRKKRIYKITQIKQRPRDPGLWDIINKYSPNFQPRPWYDHQVHGPYGPEEALIDGLQTQSFRIILASMRLFNHITDWPKLYRLAKEKECWQKVGALYDVARLFLRVRRMPEYYRKIEPKTWVQLSQLRLLNFPEIARRWKVYIPFNKYDLEQIL